MNDYAVPVSAITTVIPAAIVAALLVYAAFGAYHEWQRRRDIRRQLFADAMAAYRRERAEAALRHADADFAAWEDERCRP